MKAQRPSDEIGRIVVRCGESFRERFNALAKSNGRSANVEALKALEAWLDLAEHAQQSAHEVANDLPAPERILGTWLIHTDAEGHVTNRTLLAEGEKIEAETGTHAVDMRFITITPGQEAADPRKAKMAADVRRSVEMAKARTNSPEGVDEPS